MPNDLNYSEKDSTSFLNIKKNNNNSSNDYLYEIKEKQQFMQKSN